MPEIAPPDPAPAEMTGGCTAARPTAPGVGFALLALGVVTFGARRRGR